MSRYLRPEGLAEALEALAAGPWTVLAGGTDHYPARVGRMVAEDILDVTAIPTLRGIAEGPAGYRIGATTTWTEIAEVRLPPWFDGLKAAAREIGGAQVQSRGTVAGNLCNASPAADGIPALLSLDAEVELASRSGVRHLPLGAFVIGNRQTMRRPDELVVAVHVPRPAHPATAAFLKLGARRYLVISIAMVAGVLERAADGTVAAARLAVGACSAVARRLEGLEAELIGRQVGPALAALVEPRHLDGLAPLGDVRGSADYRTEAAGLLVRRCLQRLAATA